MAKQTINIGTTANDGTGDPLRDAFDKANDNFNELYQWFNDATSGNADRAVITDDSGYLTTSGVTSTELGYLSGVTSAIQDQIDDKQDADAQLTSIAGLTPGAEGRMITSDGLGGYQISTPGDVRGYLNVEDGADVTDTANVTSAGALMDSEVADLAGIKSLDTSTVQVKPSEGAFVDGDKTKLDGIETGATADQSDGEIETAYNNQVSVVSQAEAEAGTSTTVRRWTAERVKQAIAALAAGGGDMFAATYDPNTVAGDAFDMDNMVEGATTKIMTSAERTKLSGIETGAEVNVVDSVNSQTGAVVLDADDIDDTSTTHKFATAAELSKLAGIEANADVTDSTNVQSAGALMDSEVTNLNDVKNFDPADYAAAAHTHTLSDVTDSGALAALDTVDTAQIDNDAVTFAKMQNISTARILGRDSAGTGSVQQLTAAEVSTLLSLGDLATQDTVGTSDIDNDAVTFDKVAPEYTANNGSLATAVDWAAYTTFEKTLSGNTTLTDSNLRVGTKVLLIDGNYTLTLPAYWQVASGSYDGSSSQKNLITVTCLDATGSSEVVVCTIVTF
jgi:hypothetical protein